MQLVTDISDFDPFRGGVISIGNFDGVHLGHQAMLSQLVALASKLDVPACVMTFDPPPIALIAPNRLPPRLSSVERKLELMQQLGLDCLLVYPTSRELLNLSPEQFYHQILIEQLEIAGLVEGPNFRFGKDRAGDVNLLSSLTTETNRALEIVAAEETDGLIISSSRIRDLVQQGHINQAVNLLGHPYRLTGTVTAGAARGSGPGIPHREFTEHQDTLTIRGRLCRKIANCVGYVSRCCAHWPQPDFYRSASQN